ncbi:hypothetical protein NEMBOFW57_003950 [Staphylotrichum longicolle]|uniref:Tc toxin complex TcA C-terminal TcB-binding domain-containing protein n=1 Tax=Staphylotrichum longicolle TaxID=669026 RepID=A0AAD4F6Q9_9PEZI|nr:hypothetical protein NEMBOFW57_003950 [Staphylotrichum longicolle]
MRWIVSKDAEILVAAGMCTSAVAPMESLSLAIQRYIEAARILGSAPLKRPQLVSKRKVKVYTFETNASPSKKEVTNGLGPPFSAELVKPGDAGADTNLVSELRSFGERPLSAIERKEVEVLNLLRAKHTASLTQMMLAIKQLSLTEAQHSIESLQIDRASQVSQLEFYLRLVGEDPKKRIPSPKDAWEDIAQDVDAPSKDDLRMSSCERMEMDLSTAAAALHIVSAGIGGLVAPLCAVPEVETMASPMGVGASIGFGGRHLAAVVQAGSTALKMRAMVVAEAGGLASRKAMLSKQLQECRLQANAKGHEIKAIDKEIEMQRIRVQAAAKDIELQQSRLEDARQMEAWYRSKYTNQQLYGWLEKGLWSLYYEAYTLVMGAARRAEGSLAFEQGRKVSIPRPAGYWDSSRDGLIAADHLWLDLKRLELAHTEGRRHDYQVIKTISLLQIDPLALLRLRFTGSTTFSLGEHLFDMDFPGHYMRRIRSLAVSIPAVIGPHGGVNATLTLQSHKYRVVANAVKGDDYRAADRFAFRYDHVPISSVAISSGSHDAGVFDLSLAGERSMPFEGAGAISTWRIDLPTEVPKFDYETIGDVVFHLQYTALEGGACLKKAANESVRSIARAVQAEGAGQDGFWGIWDLKNDFLNEWHDFSWRLLQARDSKKKGGAAAVTGQPISLKLGNLKDRLPFWSRREPSLVVRSVALLSKNTKLVNALAIEGITSQSLETTDVGVCKMRSWTALAGVTSLDGWEVKVDNKLEVLGETEEKVESVYLLVNYAFKK